MASFSARPSPVPRRAIRSPGLLCWAAVALVLAGCGAAPKRVNYDPEEFDSTTTHARSYPATEAQTCEAARRALLSQGYLISAANADLVTGRKSFQPTPEVHVEVEFRVVCAHDSASDDMVRPESVPAASRRAKGVAPRSIAFVTALQDRYGIKKTNNSATLGVGVLGSVSLPFTSSDDAMVKLASETLTDERFYDRFFALLDRFLVRGASADAAEAVEPQREPPVVAPASGLAVAAPVAPPVEPVTRPLETRAASPAAAQDVPASVATPAVPAAPAAPTGPVAP